MRITRRACLHANICSLQPGAAAFGGEISSLPRRPSLFPWSQGRIKQVQEEKIPGLREKSLFIVGLMAAKASSGGENSRLLRRNSLFWRRRERGTSAGRRRLQDFGEDFSFCLALGALRGGRKEKIAGFWRRFLLLPGTRSVARWSEREDSRILEKISPFAWH